VIVAAGTHAGAHYARSEAEVAELIDHILSELVQGGRTPDGFEVMPEHATLCIVKGKYPEETDERWPSNYLHVSVNTANGYGAVRWFSTRGPENSDEAHISRFVWVSENPSPPSFDPELILDPSTPLYYPRESAIPVAHVRTVLEEFCRVRTGDRPTGVSWMVDQHTL
jgi:hypothetical protein